MYNNLHGFKDRRALIDLVDFLQEQQEDGKELRDVIILLQDKLISYFHEMDILALED